MMGISNAALAVTAVRRAYSRSTVGNKVQVQSSLCHLPEENGEVNV